MADDPPADLHKSPPDRLEEVQTRVWLRILSLYGEIFARLNRVLTAESGVSLAKFDVLAQLDRFSEGLSLGRLSQNLKVTGGNVSGLVQRLSADGLITREMSRADRRSFVVRLTPKGASVFAAARAAHQRELSACFRNVPASDLDVVLQALNGLAGQVHSKSTPVTE